jgi:hypothetical protein
MSENTELDRIVAEYLLLRGQIEELSDKLDWLKERLRTLGPGAHSTNEGVTVLITDPPRTFDVDAALAILPEPVRDLCTTIDPAKVKQYLSAQALDSVMLPGNGKRRVTVK